MSLTRRTLLISALAVPPARALAQPATPVDIESALADHVAWVVALFDGGAADLTVADVEARFDETFRAVVPPDEFIATIQQLTTQLGPIELVEDQSTETSEFIGLFRSESGDGVMISIAVDPGTGLISGFFITPAALPSDATPAASPAASPIAAGPVIDDPEAQMALHADLVAEIRAVSEPVIDAVVAGDHEALVDLVTPEVVDAFQGSTIPDVIASYTTNQLQMVFAEEQIHFFGQWNDSEISGLVVFGPVSGGPAFSLTAEEPQDGELPSGRFSGAIQPEETELSIVFGTDADGNLTAALDFPAFGVEGHELSQVAYLPERPIGEMVGESVLAHGGVNNSHRADFTWGDHLLRVSAGIDVDAGQVNALQILPAIPTPLAAPNAPEAQASYHLPFEGLWWVFWGGETELLNYHAATSSQRHAYDLVIWKDGATYRGDGARNEDYWAWRQPVYAPASGTVVSVENDLADIEPNLPPGERGAGATPAGNHVVIEAAENEYVFIAHLQRGSVRPEVGDTVSTGDLIGLTGNSGNTSEPHLHIHVQDSPEVLDIESNGIPLAFASAVVDGEPVEDATLVQGSFVASP